jgi:hypothetical protein
MRHLARHFANPEERVRKNSSPQRANARLVISHVRSPMTYARAAPPLFILFF